MAINYLGVLVAAVVAFAAGGAWYGALGKQWMAALGWSEADRADRRKKMPMGAMAATFVAELVMAFMLAGLLGHMGGPSLKTGAIAALLCWVGFVATTTASNYAFQGRALALTVIDSGHWLLVLLVIGLVLGAFG
jgi:hypothetical protein